MNPSRSLSRRLTTGLTIGLTLLWIMASGTVAYLVLHEMEELSDSGLREIAHRLLPLAVDDLSAKPGDGERRITWNPPKTGIAPEEKDDDDDDEGDYLFYQVIDAAGQVLIRSDEAFQPKLPTKLETGFETSGPWRIYTAMSADGRYFIQVAEQDEHRLETTGELIVWLLSPIAVLVPLSVIIVIVVVRRSLAPIRTLRNEIGARGGGDLSAIEAADMPSELALIVRAVNRLLLRLANALEAERAFAANSAHELRTPVAAALAQLDRLNAELAGSPGASRVALIADNLRRLGGRVEKLLQLARADAGIALREEAVDLSAVAELLAEEFQGTGRWKDRLRLTVESEAPVIVQADMDAVAIAVRNLIENALTHGADDGTVDLRVGAGRSIHVVNDGPVVSEADLTKLSERFSRGPTGASGTGLGLAIVATIVRQTGGDLELLSPAAGRPDGFEAVIRFPEPAAK